MEPTTHRLQSNDDNWHQIWKEDGEGRELPYCEIVNTHKETVAEVFRAVNTFDQARAALKDLYALVKGECPSLLNEDSGGDAELDWRITQVLAAMKGQP